MRLIYNHRNELIKGLSSQVITSMFHHLQFLHSAGCAVSTILHITNIITSTEVNMIKRNLQLGATGNFLIRIATNFCLTWNGKIFLFWITNKRNSWSYLLPSATTVAERLCFHRCLSTRQKADPRPMVRHLPPPPADRRDGHCSRRYASYWNAFLLRMDSRWQLYSTYCLQIGLFTIKWTIATTKPPPWIYPRSL